jgi:hypothetical protein
MAKVVVLYKNPKNAEAFDKHLRFTFRSQRKFPA